MALWFDCVLLVVRVVVVCDCGVVRCYGCLLIFAGAVDWNFWWGACCSVGFGGYLLDFVWVVRLFSVFLF